MLHLSQPVGTSNIRIVGLAASNSTQPGGIRVSSQGVSGSKTSDWLVTGQLVHPQQFTIEPADLYVFGSSVVNDAGGASGVLSRA